MNDPHPFYEVPDEREGYRTFHFDWVNEPLFLITIERAGDPRGPHSLIGYRNGFRSRERGGIGLTSVPGIATVDTVITILRLCAQEREIGRKEGTADAQFKMRQAMGLNA